MTGAYEVSASVHIRTDDLGQGIGEKIDEAIRLLQERIRRRRVADNWRPEAIWLGAWPLSPENRYIVMVELYAGTQTDAEYMEWAYETDTLASRVVGYGVWLAEIANRGIEA